jgi:uncharacterized membrane protein
MKLYFQLLKLANPILRTETHRWLAASMAFSVLLVTIRIFSTGTLTFIFLNWNLFLAFIPYAISSFAEFNTGRVRHRGRFAVLLAAWLLFIPNSFYIITDLFHLGISTVPLWFDLALLLSFAWNGLLLGVLSVRQIERIIHSLWPRFHELFFLLPIMFLNALGVYIGRYLRFNSWDVVSNPLELAGDISCLVLHPLASKPAWAMISCYAVLMTFIYLTIKKISRTIS